MVLDYVSLFIVLMCVIIIVVGIWKIHTLPGVIAKKRNHPQAEAIEITAYLGLIAFPLWMVALIWAHLRPVLRPTDLPAAPGPTLSGDAPRSRESGEPESGEPDSAPATSARE